MSDDDKNNSDDDDDLLPDEYLGDDYLDGVFAEDDDDSNEYLVEAMMNDLGPVSLCYFHLYFSTVAQRPLFAEEERRSELQHELRVFANGSAVPSMVSASGSITRMFSAGCIPS